MGMGMGMGVTKDGMGIDQAWNESGEMRYAHCSHLHIYISADIYFCLFEKATIPAKGVEDR